MVWAGTLLKVDLVYIAFWIFPGFFLLAVDSKNIKRATEE